MKHEIDYKSGYYLAKQNFKALFTSAKQANLNGFYGLACSLNILAAEELIKAIIVFLQSENLESEITGFKKVFSSHPAKHGILIEFLRASSNGVEALYFNILEDKEQFLSIVPKEQHDKYANEYKDIEKVKKRTEKLKLSKHNLKDIIEWLNRANDYKNNGLYTNLNKDGKWSSPQEFSKEKFKTEKAYTDLLLLYAKIIIDITAFNKELKMRNETRRL